MTQEITGKVPWLTLIIIIALTSILGSAVLLFLDPLGATLQCTYNWGICSRTTTLAVLPFILLILAYPLRKLRKINAATLTYLYTIGTVMAYSNYGGTEAGLFIPITMSSTQLFATATVRNVMGSWWWVPPYDVMEATMSGGLAVNWVSWAGAIFFWMTFNFTLFFFTSGLSLVFRQRWIAVERIPFPMTMAAHEVVRTVDVNRPADLDLKPLAVGIILGLVFEVPIFLQAILPWFPDIYGWRTLTCPGGTQQISPTDTLSQNIVGLAMVSKDPVAFSLFYLAPLSVSFNVWFWTLVTFALMQIAYSMGYYTGIFSLSSACCKSDIIMASYPFYWEYMSTIGGSTAIVAMILFNSRHYLRETLRQALSSRSSIADTERKEATSYRMAYFILVAGTVMILLWLMSAGIDFLSALSILIFTIFIGGVSGFYTYAHTGFAAINNLQGSFADFPLLVRFSNQIPSLTEPNIIMSNFLGGTFSNGTILMDFPTAQMMPFRMADLTGTSNRNTYLVAIVTVLIATPLILMTKIWVVSAYGTKVFSTKYGCSVDGICAGNLQSGITNFPHLIEYGAIGFVITFTLAMLHSRFVWFPFEPLGFVIATSMAGSFYGVWSAFLGAWIVKTIVLRVGGSKLYERSVPLVGGLLAGVFIGVFAGSIIMTLKFFIPF
jgi:hypothetical protein